MTPDAVTPAQTDALIVTLISNRRLCRELVALLIGARDRPGFAAMVKELGI